MTEMSSINVEFETGKEPAGAIRILAERLRVMNLKGFSAEHDEMYTADQLPNAALAYLLPGKAEAFWPWDMESFKGGHDMIGDLVRAGQFIAAEIDRLELEQSKAVNPRSAISDEMAPAVLSYEPEKLILKGYYSTGVRRISSDLLDPGVEVFEPGTGSDPATWFEGELPTLIDTPDNPVE